MSATSAIMAWTAELAHGLSNVRWGAGELSREQVEEHLAGCVPRVGAFSAELAGLAPECFETMLLRSRETATHFKWHLCSGEGFVAWLHEYKPWTHRGPGYAESVHNHRYSLSSLILRGGYTHHRFIIENAEEDGRARAVQLWSRSLRQGDMYSLSEDDVHRVADPIDGTVTLVVQHPAVRPYSTSVNIADGRLVRHYPIESRYARLRSLLT